MSADIDRVFRVGDVVRAYGVPGPRMVVSKIVSDKGGVLVRCFWFNRKNEFTGQDFGPSFLCKATPWVDRPQEGAMSAIHAIEEANLEDSADAGD